MPQAAAPAPSSTPAATEKPKGLLGIWIGVLLMIGGIVLGIALIVVGATSLLNGFDDLQRVPINGGGVVRIEETGTQTIYAERPSSGSGTSFNTGAFSGFGPDVDVRVIGPAGDDLIVATGGATETYTYDGREGVKIGSFVAATEGTYRIVARSQDGGVPGGYTTIAVGTGLELSGIGTILGGVFGGGLLVLIGILVVIIFAVRRSRSKKRIAQASAPYPGSYGGPAAGWPTAPGYPPAGYAPTAPGGTGAPAAPAPGGWPPAGTTNPGWVPPPAPPASEGPGPTWSPPPPPAPQTPANPTWPPAGDAPAAPPEASPSEGSSAPSWSPPPWEPPTWQPPAGDPPPPASDAPPPAPPRGGDGDSAS